MRTNEDLQKHATDLLVRAKSGGVSSLRLLGGVAIRRLFPRPASDPVLQRVCKDLDFAVGKRDARKLVDVFKDCGFEANRQFNALHGATRLMFLAGDLQADIFVSEFTQCHKLALEPRLRLIEESLPPADLLLMKLQVVEINEKDLQDLCIILLGAEIGTDDNPGVINMKYIMQITAQEWGWFTTCSDTLHKVNDYVSANISEEEQQVILPKLQSIEEQMLACPKTMKWKMRNSIGRKVLWYRLPEEARR